MAQHARACIDQRKWSKENIRKYVNSEVERALQKRNSEDSFVCVLKGRVCECAAERGREAG